MTTTLCNKKDSLVKRINNAFKMFSIANFVEEYTPSKYAEKLLDEDLEVDGLSIKIQLVRDSISAVLDHLGFEEGVILKVAAAKVSQLMDSMDLFVGIAKGQKEAKDLVDLVGMIPDLTDTTTFNNKLKNADKVKDAIDFIKDIIHPDSVVNKKPSTRVAGKSARKSKKLEVSDEVEDTLETANEKLKEEENSTESLTPEELTDEETSGEDNEKPEAAQRKSSGAVEDLDDGEASDNTSQDNAEKSSEGDESSLDDTVTPAASRKMNHRKKVKNSHLATKKNVLGNFVEVPTAKRISKSKRDNTESKLEDLLDNGGDEDNVDKPETTDNEVSGEDVVNIKVPAQPNTSEGLVDKKSKRMSSKKNKKIRGLTKKNSKRLSPRFMTDLEIENHEKNDKESNDQFSFISLREDNKDLKGKKNSKHHDKSHRKNTEETIDNEKDTEANEGDDAMDKDNGLKGKTNEAVSLKSSDDEEVTNDTDGLKTDDDDSSAAADDSLEGESQDLSDEASVNSANAGTGKRIRKSHKHRRF